MNVRTNELARSAQGESSCGFCNQPLFGPVAYCPYCGKPGVASTSRQPDDRPRDEKAVATGQGNPGMPPGAFPLREDEPPRNESRRKPGAGLPIFGTNAPAGPDVAAAPEVNRTTLTALFITAAAVGALLLWVVFRMLAPTTDPEAPAQLPGSTSGVAPAPATSAAQAPPIPARTDTAVPRPPVPARTETAVPSPSSRNALCSAANEQAGLCKPQQ